MRKQECKDCGCAKSEHTSTLCKGCLVIYDDNYKEYLEQFKNSKNYVYPGHKFKLDNLKYLEQIYESKRD